MSDSADERWMRVALAQAREACEHDEVPIGAVLVGADDTVLGLGSNQSIQADDATAHAEIVALRQASRRRGSYRLPGTTLFVTVEPCMMCVGAMVHARIERLVFGAPEPKAGAVISHPQIHSPWLNHHIDITAGVLEETCAGLMQGFFAARRRPKS
ncbi:MAG: tRNA adenosine(34) deaminase TadA [Pseudomonadota bacterium]